VKTPINRHELRESWLRAALNDLRPYFASAGYSLPDNIRVAVGFPSTGRRNKQVGETWDKSTSGDASYEIFIRPDLSEPVDVLAVLAAKAIHTALPANSGHGKLYKAAAVKLGLEGKMREPVAGVLLLARLNELAANLGSFPHASLVIANGPAIGHAVDRPKKQTARMLKAECSDTGCGYTVRIAAKWALDPGPPHCPKHGAMAVERIQMDEPESELAHAVQESV
jgi:hypothetical protein